MDLSCIALLVVLFGASFALVSWCERLSRSLP
jgi:hypothetical protein